MSRPLRLEFAGALYHIISRGIEGKNIFTHRKDREKFIHYLKENIQRYETKLYVYVLMDNHYHLLLETPMPNLSKFMHTLNASYVVYHNRRHSRVGPLLQGRYKAILVDREAYLLELSRYIHLNPVRARSVTAAEKFEWSSYRTYLGMKTEEWVDCEWARERFGKNWRKKYRQFVEEPLETTDLFKKVKAGCILGSELFAERVKKKIGLHSPQPEIPSSRALKSPSMNEVVAGTSEFFGIDEGEILRRRRNFLPRKIALYLVRKHTAERIEQIGRKFRINYPAVSKTIARMKAAIERDEEKKRIVSMVEQKLLCL